MSPKLKSLSLVIVFVYATFIGLPNEAHAAYKIEKVDVSNIQQKDFVVGPGKVELEIKPGESKTSLITVTNRMGDTRIFNLDIEDFTGSRDPRNTVVLLGNERGPYSLKDFISIEDTSFELKNGEKATIPVRVSLPTDAEPGGKYGSVLISTTAKSATIAQGSAIVSRLGILFFVKTPGEVQEDGLFKDFVTVNDQSIYGSGPVSFHALYENNGSVYLNPYGEVRINNMLGQEVGAVQIEPWFVMPQSLRVREFSWDRPFLFGRYTATASINRGYGDIVDTKTVSFWVIPWKITSLGFACLVILVLMVRFVISKFEIKRK